MDPVEALWAAHHAAPSLSTRNALLKHYRYVIRMVVAKIVKTTQTTDADVDDLTSLGVIGLIDAISKFEPYRQLTIGEAAPISAWRRFAPYAYTRVHGCIMSELRVLDQVPRTVRQNRLILDRTISSLTNRLGRPPTRAEVAERMEVDLGTIHTIIHDSHAIQAQPITFTNQNSSRFGGAGARGDAVQATVFDFHPDATQTTEGEFDVVEIRSGLLAALESLPRRDKIVLALIYIEAMTFDQVAALFEVSRTRVSQLHRKAMLRLRAAIAGSHVDTHLSDARRTRVAAPA